MMASHKALEVSNKALVASHQALEASNKALGANHSVLDRKLTETLEEKTQLTARVCRLSDTISQLKLDAAERKNDAKIFQERASKHRKEMAELLERLDGQARQFEDEIGRLEAKITQQDEKAATSAEVLAGYKRTVTQVSSRYPLRGELLINLY
jgi:chromosome segregation ATPase